MLNAIWTTIRAMGGNELSLVVVIAVALAYIVNTVIVLTNSLK